MNTAGLIPLLPFIVLVAAGVLIMLVISIRRDHLLTAQLTAAGLAAAVLSIPAAARQPQSVTPLVLVDHYGLYYSGLVFLAGIAVAGLAYSYLEKHNLHREEFYLLLLTACLGSAVLAVSTHFMSLFLGIEILSVSLYALAGYLRHSDRSTEAGVKYLILAAVSSAFILFGMALVYASLGTMSFAGIAARASGLLATAGLILVLVGLGFKLAVVPFHFWTPDVYEGAPVPVTAFIATVSKGAVFAALLRLYSPFGSQASSALPGIFAIIAVLSMFAGNLLALMQQNVKRILAYSSISHMGYLLVTLMAGGTLRWSASAFYLAAYFVTSLGAFGVISILSTAERDADRLEDYRGLAWRRPWLAGTFTAMLLSLAGIPLTAGFIAKFYLVAAGVSSGLWMLVIVLAVNSALGLFYYLRIVAALYTRSGVPHEATREGSRAGTAVLAGLCLALIWLGTYPGPFLSLIEKVIGGLQQ
jgi:NADH-quinone oxidoreductase subunit N